VVTEALGPTWGYHVNDINLTLGNLVNDVKAQESSYSAHHKAAADAETGRATAG
jgi:hypothetical protein